jgi:hypothetical protein
MMMMIIYLTRSNLRKPHLQGKLKNSPHLKQWTQNGNKKTVLARETKKGASKGRIMNG